MKLKLVSITLILGLGLGLGLLMALGLSASISQARLDAPPLALVPPRNAVTATLNTRVSATYDEPISPTTVTSRTFAVHGMQSGLVTATHGVAYGGNTIIVTPTRPFHQGELVYAVATTGTLNVAGTGPLSGTLWQFNAGEVRERCVAGFSEVYTGSLTGVYYSSVAWGDYDNDGDLDILLTGNSYGTLIAKVYQNTGSGFSEVYAGSLTSVSVSSVAWGDYDNDGDLDILLTGYDNSSNSISKIYQNTGSGFSEVYPESLTGVKTSSAAWGDYDNDGDLDILLTGVDSSGIGVQVSKVYQNTSSDFSEVYTGSLTGVWHSSAAWGDYDNDGDLDILLTGWDSGSVRTSKIYQNTGSGFSEVYPGSLIGVRFGSVAWGDYDNDGDLDILLTGAADSGRIARVYQNTGSGFSEVYPESLTGVWYSSVAWGDYDNDGDLDILSTGDYWDGSDNYDSRVYQNTDSGFSEVYTRDLTGVRQGSVAWGDYDNDGDLDILLTGDSGDGSIAKVYRNDDCSPPALTGIAPPRNTVTATRSTTITATYDQPISPTTVTSRTFAVHGMQSGLLTQTYAVDGSIVSLTPAHPLKPGELVQVSATTGTLNLSGQGPVSPTVWQFRAAVAGGRGVFSAGQYLDYSNSRAAALGDLNGDNDLDVFIACAPSQANQVWLNDGTGNLNNSGQALGDSSSYAVALGDLDGDSDLDAFVANYTQADKIWLNDGAGNFSRHQSLYTLADSRAVALGDLDGDGDLDALVGGSGGGEVWWNDGTGTFSDSGQSLGISDSWAVALGDLDNDGDLDAFVDNGASSFKVWLNDGTGSLNDSGHSVSTAGSDVALGDVDGDGDLDVLIGACCYEPNQVWLNDGGVFSNSDQVLDLGGSGGTPIALGDIDGDGDLDALLGTWGGENDQIWLNNGMGDFVESDHSLGSSWSHDVALGDMDGDGDLDALAVSSGARVWLNGNAAGEPDVTVNPLALSATLNLDATTIRVLTIGNVGGADLTWSLAEIPDVTWLTELPTDGAVAPAGSTDVDVTFNAATLGTGVYTTTLRVTSDDPDEPTVDASVTLTVINTPPSISNIANQSTDVNAAVGPVAFTVGDAETAPSALTLDGASSNVTLAPPANITFGGSGVDRTVTVTPAADLMGTAAITITVSDGELSAYDNFVLTVGVNSPPEFSSTPVETATVDILYTYAIIATDADAGDILTITAPTKPDWLSLADHGPSTGSGQAVTATLSGTPSAKGDYAVALQVTDGKDNVSQTFTITVSAPTCPHPLGDVSISGPSSGYTDTLDVFTAAITPVDASAPITYTWSPEPEAGQSSVTVSYTWATIGVQAITVTAENCAPPSIVTVSDTHTITISTPPPGDPYEDDDTCAQAKFIPTDDTVQMHTFHDQADEDWVAFQAGAGITYVITVRVPPTSTADAVIEIHDSCDSGGSFDGDDPTFSPEIRIVFTTPVSGMYYLRLLNHDPTRYGPDVAYHVSIRALQDTLPSGAIILVAGRLRTSDDLQRNIHNVTNAVYRLARENGCAPEQIYYLATDLGLDADGDGQPDVNQRVTSDTLRYAITQWALDKVGPAQALTVYMMDHGGYDKFYLDEPNGERVTPGDLDGWLEGLETNVPGVPINVVVDACRSGSFIDPIHKVSQGGRVVIASTNAHASAYASLDGAAFSDPFLTALEMGMSLRGAFEEAEWALGQSHPLQTPWLDDTGEGHANTPKDGDQAVERGLTCATLATDSKWPPYIERAEIRTDRGSRVDVCAQVRDDKQVKWVWAAVYPPSWDPPDPGDDLIAEPSPITLQPRGSDDWYCGAYELDEVGRGTYRIVVYAEDDEGLGARPKEKQFTIRLYLPLVLKQYTCP